MIVRQTNSQHLSYNELVGTYQLHTVLQCCFVLIVLDCNTCTFLYQYLGRFRAVAQYSGVKRCESLMISEIYVAAESAECKPVHEYTVEAGTITVMCC